MFYFCIPHLKLNDLREKSESENMFNEQMWNSSVEGQTAPHVNTTTPAPGLQLAISKLKNKKTFCPDFSSPGTELLD